MQTNPNFRITAEYQNAVDKFLRPHILWCVSELVSEIAQNMDSERVMELSGKLDWEGALREHIMNGMTRSEIEDELLCGFGTEIPANATDREIEDMLFTAVQEKGNAQEWCEYFSVDPQEWEVYEHWQVSEWLADRLGERGEIVDKDFYGLCVWGRTCTGQSIILDSVIQDIYDATL